MYNQPIPAAPMSTMIKVVTVLTSSLLVVIIALGLFTGPRDLWVWTLAMVGSPLAILLIGPLFMVRGYLLEEDRLRVQRLGWFSDIDLRQLRGFRRDPEALKGAWRLCGNGGLFCFCGYFRSKKFGGFRPFVTNPSQGVVIQTASTTYIISPEDPDAFLALLSAQFGDRANLADIPTQGRPVGT